MSDWMKSCGAFLTESKQPIEEASPQEIASLDKILLGIRYEDLYSITSLATGQELPFPSVQKALEQKQKSS